MPRRSCCIPSCTSTLSEGAVLHIFPHPEKELERFLTWVDNIGGELANLDHKTIYTTKKVCRIHFETILLYPKNRLCRNAIPTLHLQGEKEPQTNIEQEINENNSDHDVDHYEQHTNAEPTLKPDDSNTGPFSWHVPCETAVDSDDANTGPFSWNKTCETVIDNESDVNVEKKKSEETPVIIIDEEVQEKCKDEKVECDTEENEAVQSDVHEDFRCNTCTRTISGFRYTCVQCVDYDVCPACEMRGVHAMHYVLRVPGPRPHGEVQSMLAAMRRVLFHSNVDLRPTDAGGSPENADSIKLEDLSQDPLENIMDGGSVQTETSTDVPQDKDIQHIDIDPAETLQSKEYQLYVELPKYLESHKENSQVRDFETSKCSRGNEDLLRFNIRPKSIESNQEDLLQAGLECTRLESEKGAWEQCEVEPIQNSNFEDNLRKYSARRVFRGQKRKLECKNTDKVITKRVARNPIVILSRLPLHKYFKSK